jgi:hypothetical protein
MVEQPEILEHDAHPAAQARERVVGDTGHILAEQGDQPSGRLHGEKDQAEQRRLPRPGRAGEKLNERGAIEKERSRRTSAPMPIAEADIVELHAGALALRLWLARQHQKSRPKLEGGQGSPYPVTPTEGRADGGQAEFTPINQTSRDIAGRAASGVPTTNHANHLSLVRQPIHDRRRPGGSRGA